MPRTPVSSATRRRNLAVLRGAGFVIAIVLSGIGVWLIVTGTGSAKHIEIGVITGLWGLLLGSFSILGSRSLAAESAAASAAAAAAAAAAIPPAPVPGHALDLREIGEIERAAVAAARLEFQAELQEMLRREVQAGLAHEVAGLRAEVAALRNELLEKVGGQLRLERIETTRLIGSDLEALQHELRQLRHIGGVDVDDESQLDTHTVSISKAVDIAKAVDAGAGSPPPPPPPGRPGAGPPWVVAAPDADDSHDADHGADIHDAEIVEVEEVEEASEPVEAAEPAEGAPSPGGLSPDPFASMPRITPFTDFALDPIPPTPPAPAASRPADDEDEDDDEGESPRRRRRHRADGDGNDVLARILARESR